MNWRTANNRRAHRRDSRLIVYDIRKPALFLYPVIGPIRPPPTPWELAARRVRNIKFDKRLRQLIPGYGGENTP